MACEFSYMYTTFKFNGSHTTFNLQKTPWALVLVKRWKLIKFRKRERERNPAKGKHAYFLAKLLDQCSPFWWREEVGEALRFLLAFKRACFESLLWRWEDHCFDDDRPLCLLLCDNSSLLVIFRRSQRLKTDNSSLNASVSPQIICFKN